MSAGIYGPLHVISWPYLDIVSALTVGRHLPSLVRRCSTRCQMIYEILQSALQLSDSRWKHITFSTLGVSHVMRYINARYLLTYFLTCLRLSRDGLINVTTCAAIARRRLETSTTTVLMFWSSSTTDSRRRSLWRKCIQFLARSTPPTWATSVARKLHSSDKSS